MARLSESPISLGSVKCFSAGEKRLWTGCPEHGAMPGQVGRPIRLPRGGGGPSKRLGRGRTRPTLTLRRRCMSDPYKDCDKEPAAAAPTPEKIPEPIRCWRVELLEIRVYPDEAALAVAAAHEAAAVLQGAIRQYGRARVVFACAASQIRFLEALTARTDVDWSRVEVFHMDEYLGMTPDHPASFRRFLRERLVEKVRPGRVHELCGDAPEPLKEIRRYSALLAEAPLHLCCLGIGENGHLAFNDPPVADFEDPDLVKLVALDEACRRQQVGEGWFPHLEAVPRFAYTLTLPALCRARRLLAVVPERRKALAIARALTGPIDPACPASILRRHGSATLFLDLESAALVVSD